jgi:hypothetical protein
MLRKIHFWPVVAALLFLFCVFQASSTSAEEAGASALNIPVVSGGPGYLAINPTEFRALDPANPAAFSGTSLYNPGSGYAYYIAPVRLPQGMTIKKLVAYYYDKSVESDLYVAIMYCPLDVVYCMTMGGAGSFSTSDTPQYSETTSFSPAVIDMRANSYMLQLEIPGDAGTALSLYGVRVDYGATVALPAVRKGP